MAKACAGGGGGGFCFLSPADAVSTNHTLYASDPSKDFFVFFSFFFFLYSIFSSIAIDERVSSAEALLSQ